MQFFTSINIKPLEPPITYRDKLLLTGSCFTEHIGNFLMDIKFNVLQNPNGILFDPISASNSLISYIQHNQCSEDDLFHFNPNLKIIFTISPVRHLRDGVIDNNRSKARLIEAVHHFVNKFDRLYYFPAYELVIDVLRDYRFYDVDLAHPNYAATQFVLEKFSENCFSDATKKLSKEIKKL